MSNVVACRVAGSGNKNHLMNDTRVIHLIAGVAIGDSSVSYKTKII